VYLIFGKNFLIGQKKIHQSPLAQVEKGYMEIRQRKAMI
jgi:hypothetical protein